MALEIPLALGPHLCNDKSTLVNVASIYKTVPNDLVPSAHCLAMIFSKLLIYAWDFLDVIKLNKFFVALLSSRNVLCHSKWVQKLCNSLSWKTYSFSSLTLNLNIGTPICLTNKILTNAEVPKGTRLIIKSITEDKITASVLLNGYICVEVYIYCCVLHCCNDYDPPSSFVCEQFPIEPLFANLLPCINFDATKYVAIFKAAQQYVSFSVQ
ncbi:hypothetical protein MJO28_015641 [Puccinia striiformis f. sp. tritici]|uniref:Uncharacterized protein n=1 Tax=Puccinia striiformis f. sp. tritici TaxID=168172 RepID=A0ACC0DPX2_9BASI|nr:hypothetical protein MJO28_015641 [Puccinia striiformis f. sp. tritici]